MSAPPAASAGSRWAIRAPAGSVATYTLPRVVSQLRHIEGTPFGTRGGISVVHNFPVDGEYVFRMSFYYSGLAVLYGEHELQGPQQIDVSVNGERVALLDIPPRLKLSDRPAHRKDQGQGRPAAHLGGVHPEGRRPGRRRGPAARAEPGRRQQRERARHHRAAAPARSCRRRALRGHRHVADRVTRARSSTCQPKSPADETALRQVDHHRRWPVRPTAGRWPTATCRASCGSTAWAAARRAASKTASAPRFRPSSPAPSSSSASSARRRASRRAPTTASPISNWRRGCRSSCGAAVPTTSCSSWPRPTKLRDPAGARAAGAAHAGRPAGRGAVDQLRVQWLHLQNLKDMRPDSYQYPDFDMNLMKSMTPRNAAVLRQHRARGPADHRPAHRRLHLRRRPAGAGTTAFPTCSAAASAACRSPTRTAAACSATPACWR